MSHRRVLFWLVPALRDIYFIIVLLSIYCYGSLLSDCDTGYHVRAGDYILENLSIPKTDLFSYLTPPPRWTAHEWLSEVIMSSFHQLWGLNGVVILFSIIIAFTYYFLLRSLRSLNGNLLLLMGLGILIALTSTIHWLARPHIFTLFFLVIWYHLLDQYQYKKINHNLLIFLPIIMVLWVNLHGGFIIGFFLLAIYFLGNLYEWLTDKIPEHRQITAKRCKFLFLVGTACSLAALANPYGYHIFLFPFQLVGNEVLMSFAEEFHPANLQEAHPYKYLLFLTFFTLLASRYRLNIIELLLILLFTYMSLYSVRNIPLFAIIVAPIILKRLDALFQQSHNPIIKYLNE
ncbi:MAG: hypothetical protein R6U11_04855, partial [Bacteroidales bacterium]